MSILKVDQLHDGCEWQFIKKGKIDSLSSGGLEVEFYDEANSGDWVDLKVIATGFRPTTDSVTMYGKVALGADKTYVTSGYKYTYCNQFSNVADHSTGDSLSAGVWVLATGQGNDFNTFAELEAIFYGVNSTGSFKCGTSNYFFYDVNDPSAFNIAAWHITGASSDVLSAVTIYPSSGQLKLGAGDWRLYGRPTV